MSRETATEHTTTRKADPGIGRAHDLDADHDPQAARRTSLTGLRRVADDLLKGKPAGTAAEKHQVQHEKAESASFDGIQAALAYGSASIHGRATAIHTLIRSNPDDGGPMKIIAIMDRMAKSVDTDLRRLSLDVGTQVPNNTRNLLAPEARRLAGALDRFSDAWGHALTYATQHGETLGENPHWYKQHIEQIYTHLKLDKTVTADLSVDEQTDGQLLKRTIEANLTAAGECARAVRMGMTTRKDVVLHEDLEKLFGHLREVDASLVQASDPAVVRSFKQKLGEVLAAVRALEAEGASRAAVANTMQATEVSSMLGRLKGKAR